MRATPSDDAHQSGLSHGSGRHAAPESDPAAATSPIPGGPADPPSGPGGKPPATGGARKKLLAAGAVVALLALIGVIFAVTQGSDDETSSPTPSASAGEGSTGGTGTKFGVFRQTSADNVEAYQQWLGADVEYVVDFSARGTWDNIANPQYLFDEWADTPYRLVYGVPLLPTDVEGVSIQAGAAGDYNDYFRNLADNLVKAGQEDAVLRVGWEFNLESWKWASDDAESWKAFYRNVVETMRSVDGAKFEFDWNVNGGPNKYDAANYYPGDDVVDYVGVDAYDVSGAAYPYPDDCDSACYVKAQKKAWDVSIYGGDRGLQYWSQFAKDHGKPLSIPEWGVWARPDGIGGHDNPDYIQRMYDFITDPANNVAYAAYFEYDYTDGQGGRHSLENSFPNSAAKFKELFVPLYQKADGS
ncbi:hypothetical protein LWF15_13850 [Kineosporia rhizophila]|uniref:glycosyl hydrolase n=1 Tax=Kineosporia rhizophila TaxID=84633 RepID=UPI001E454AE3|nr:glycosyl hydrolase [Kineosporia rhizophila]MCE0536592.1 hypothetical protein [Kineosporia rhizophila]